MGSDDIFKKKRAKRKARTYEEQNPKANSYLIVTEGEKTEPLYFQGLADAVLAGAGGSITVKPHVDISGEGKSTLKLVEKTKEMVNRSRIIYENVWVVFDKDDFIDFDNAIEIAQKNGFNVAWSNESFEYWLYLHFYYSDSAMSRGEWVGKLSQIVKGIDFGADQYRKNDQNIYSIFSQNNGIDKAIRNAQRVMKIHDDKLLPSQKNPATTVYELVADLQKYKHQQK